MAHSNNKQEIRLQKLIGTANQMSIEVRTEKLMREVGYRVRSGRCRFKGKDIILIDRDAPISEQIEFLAAELAQSQVRSN
jgi:hypothetical protein